MLKSYKIILHPFRHQFTQGTGKHKESTSNETVRERWWRPWFLPPYVENWSELRDLCPVQLVIRTACQNSCLSTEHTTELHRQGLRSSEHAELSADRELTISAALEGFKRCPVYRTTLCFMWSPCRLVQWPSISEGEKEGYDLTHPNPLLRHSACFLRMLVSH